MRASSSSSSCSPPRSNSNSNSALSYALRPCCYPRRIAPARLLGSAKLNAKQGSLRFHDGLSMMISAASPAKRFFYFNSLFFFFVITPDEARREQPIGGLCLRVHARVRSVWRSKVLGISKSAIFVMFAFFTAALSEPTPTPATPSERRTASEPSCRSSAADPVVRAPIIPPTHARAVSCAPPCAEWHHRASCSLAGFGGISTNTPMQLR